MSAGPGQRSGNRETERGGRGSIGAMSIVPIQGVLLERGGGSVMAAFIIVITLGMLVAYYLADRGANVR